MLGFVWMLLLVGAEAGPLPAYAQPEAEVPVAADPFRWDWALEQDRVVLTLHVPEGHVVYRDTLAIEVRSALGAKVGRADLPPGKTKRDPARPQDDRELYDADVVIYLPLARRAPEGGLLELTAHHQGCHGGICFSPASTDLLVPLPRAAASAAE